jgi:hypothetical protein
MEVGVLKTYLLDRSRHQRDEFITGRSIEFKGRRQFIEW